ncbi:MAG TPA: GGDEF domain-containing protein [Pyrinomonadaceae bacterium]|jgi:diguanylate cyclase (GGDEF)-like protein|nr:GGDEF domain-containing protein [Pyrinomonadaceae bacterium]
MDSKIGLIIQLAGVALITLLTLFLRRSIVVVALKHWTNAWLFLCVALFCLRLAFGYEAYSTQLFSFYFLTEYLFGFLLVSGCRSLAANSEMQMRQELFVLPFILVAFGLPFLGDDFNLVFNVHSLILSGFFAIAFLVLWRTRLKTFGWKVMLVALGLLIVDFFQYFLVFSLRQYYDVEFGYLQYNSVIDLVLQILLGFGMVIVLLELVLADAKVANEKLKRAHERLEELAHIDPLTTALNRHAFHGYLSRNGNAGKSVTGCVGFFDIDDLKTVNDIYGHAVGDIVIRAVVRAIREIIRGEDLLFRWGGDEFFVIMVGLDSAAANSRMARMETLLSKVRIEGVNHLMSIGVSHAFEDFADLTDLEATIEKADAGMYRQKLVRKGKVVSPSAMAESDALVHA